MQRNVNLFSKITLIYLLSLINPFILFYVSIRILNIYEFGELRLILTLLPILQVFSLPGLDNLVIKYSSIKKKLNLYHLLRYKLFFSLIGSASIGLYLILFDVSGELRFLLLSLMLIFPIFDIGHSYKNYLYGKGLKNTSLKLQLILSISSTALFIVGIALIYIFNIYNLYIFPLWMICTSIPSLYIYFKIANKIKKNNIFYINFRYGLFASFVGILYTINFSLDKIVIRYNLGPVYLAKYVCLIFIPLELSKLINSFITANYKSYVISDGFKIIPRYLLIIFLLVLAYILFFYFLSGDIFGRQYIFDFSLIVLSMVLCCTSTLSLYASQKIQFNESKKFQIVFFSSCTIINFLILSLVVKEFEFYGAIFVQSFVYLISSVWYLIYRKI
jgi:O-antigen/teichoic acid export membrane protein